VQVRLSKTARKQLNKVPPQIARKFALWADLVKGEGLEAARAIPGYADHLLRGEWEGYRAIRLSQAYRAIYIVKNDNAIEMAFVEEVNKHDY
jgi:proteic killer suppression protein